jgi:adenylate kinase
VRIVITGSVGTGKSSIARALGEKLKLPVIHLTEFCKQRGLVEGIEVDIERLRSTLLKELPPAFIVEGHLACEFSIPADVVVVLRAKKKVLEERLAKRGYDRKKIHENVMAEVMDYCLIRAEENYGSVIQVDTSLGTAEENAEKVLEYMKAGKSDRVDHSRELEEVVMDDLRFM